MKTFLQYLQESKSESKSGFKIKIAGDCESDAVKKIEEALKQFKCECTKGLTSPIQEKHRDFPEQKNVAVTVFEVKLEYPATHEQVRNLVSEALGKNQSCVKVRTSFDEHEMNLGFGGNTENMEKTHLGKPYPKIDYQNLAGQKHVDNFLKGLSKSKHTGEIYKDANSKLFGYETSKTTEKSMPEPTKSMSIQGNRPMKKEKTR